MKRISTSTWSWQRIASVGLFVLTLPAVVLIANLLLTPPPAHEKITHQPQEASEAAVPQRLAPAITPTPVFTPDVRLPASVGGLAPVISTLPTKRSVVFLGIDDGAFKDPSVVELMRKNNIKASLFLSKLFIANNPDFFKQLTAQGSVAEDHTISHTTTMTRTMSYLQQKSEICAMADYEEKIYGKRPTLFRPPGGAYSDTMRRAAHDCGMRAVVTWIAKANGGGMQYQVGNKLRPGDIVLMHFRPEFAKDMQAFVEAETAAGLHTELLEDIPSAP